MLGIPGLRGRSCGVHAHAPFVAIAGAKTGSNRPRLRGFEPHERLGNLALGLRLGHSKFPRSLAILETLVFWPHGNASAKKPPS